MQVSKIIKVEMFSINWCNKLINIVLFCPNSHREYKTHDQVLIRGGQRPCILYQPLQMDNFISSLEKLLKALNHLLNKLTETFPEFLISDNLIYILFFFGIWYQTCFAPDGFEPSPAGLVTRVMQLNLLQTLPPYE